MLRTIALCAALCALTACAWLAPLPVRPGDPSACSERRQDRLLFGMNSPDGPVAEAQWQAFLAEVVTPGEPVAVHSIYNVLSAGARRFNVLARAA